MISLLSQICFILQTPGLCVFLKYLIIDYKRNLRAAIRLSSDIFPKLTLISLQIWWGSVWRASAPSLCRAERRRFEPRPTRYLTSTNYLELYDFPLLFYLEVLNREHWLMEADRIKKKPAPFNKFGNEIFEDIVRVFYSLRL